VVGKGLVYYALKCPPDLKCYSFNVLYALFLDGFLSTEVMYVMGVLMLLV
jgi:hypothetical protein